MAGDEQGHQLVADLLLGHRRAVLVAGVEQHGQDVVAVRALGAALGDQLEHQLVDLGLDAHERGERPDASPSASPAGCPQAAASG